jgi:DUF2914 family protein
LTKRNKPEKVRKIISGGCPTEQVLQIHGLLSTAKLRAALSKPALPVFFFFAGVTYDTVTLTRIDRLLDNVILLAYLVVLGLLVAITGRAGTMRATAPADERSADRVVANLFGSQAVNSFVGRTYRYYPMVMQFLLGGLFSAYTIYYSRSASWSTTAIFFALLVAVLVANEFLRSRLSSFRLLVGLYALVTFSFFTFALPVLTGWMNTLVFLLGAILSGTVTVGLVRFVYRGRPDWSREDLIVTAALPVGLILLMVGFYFLKFIPPVPLSMKFGGIYHAVGKTDDRYQLSFEKPRWYELFTRSDNPYRGEGPAYCFTAVFAPVALETTVYHHWQYRPANSRTKQFATSDRIPIAISGGREAGYRGYTVKQRLIPGDWRVDVETEDGRLVGRVKFRVEEPTNSPRPLKTLIY